MAMVAVPLVLAACIVPFEIYDASSDQGAGSYAIFSQGGLWYAAEPVAVMVLGLTVGVFAVAFRSRTVLSVAAGVLFAIGVQTFFMFVGYAAQPAFTSGAHTGYGGFIGLVGGLLLFLGGLAILISLFTRPTQPL